MNYEDNCKETDKTNESLRHCIIKVFTNTQPVEYIKNDPSSAQTPDINPLDFSDGDTISTLEIKCLNNQAKKLYFEPFDVKGDGNCFFRSILQSGYDFKSENYDKILKHCLENKQIKTTYCKGNKAQPVLVEYDLLRKLIVHELSIKYFGKFYTPITEKTSTDAKTSDTTTTEKTTTDKTATDTTTTAKTTTDTTTADTTSTEDPTTETTNETNNEFEIDDKFKSLLHRLSDVVPDFFIGDDNYKESINDLLQNMWEDYSHSEQFMTMLVLLIFNINVIILARGGTFVQDTIQNMKSLKGMKEEEVKDIFGDDIKTIYLLHHMGGRPFDDDDDAVHFLYLRKVENEYDYDSKMRFKTVYLPVQLNDKTTVKNEEQNRTRKIFNHVNQILTKNLNWKNDHINQLGIEYMKFNTTVRLDEMKRKYDMIITKMNKEILTKFNEAVRDSKRFVNSRLDIIYAQLTVLKRNRSTETNERAITGVDESSTAHSTQGETDRKMDELKTELDQLKQDHDLMKEEFDSLKEMVKTITETNVDTKVVRSVEQKAHNVKRKKIGMLQWKRYVEEFVRDRDENGTSLNDYLQNHDVLDLSHTSTFYTKIKKFTETIDLTIDGSSSNDKKIHKRSDDDSSDSSDSGSGEDNVEGNDVAKQNESKVSANSRKRKLKRKSERVAKMRRKK